MDPNERLTGIASMMQPQGGAPMGGGAPAPMAPPPMPQPEMSGPPPMPMGGGEPPMDPMMGGGEPPMNVEQDAAMLAEAVVGRTQGDIGAAVDVLDTAKAMLMSSGNQEPQMMNMGGPLYAESGKAISNEVKDTDTLRQMIMDDLAQVAATAARPDLEGRAVSEADIAYIKNLLNEGQVGRTMSDKDTSRLTQLGDLWRKDMEMYEEYSRNNPELSEYIDIITRGGKALSEEDAQMLYEMGIRSGEIGSTTNPDPLDSLGRTMSDIDWSKLKNISPSYRQYEKMKKKENVPPVSRAVGGPLMTDAQKYREAIKEARMAS